LPEMGSGCFGSTDVPPNRTATIKTGRACAGKWRTVRARDGQVQAFSRPGGAWVSDPHSVFPIVDSRTPHLADERRRDPGGGGPMNTS